MRRLMGCLIAVLFIAGSAAAQGARHTGTAIRATAAIPGASVRVCTETAVGTPCLPLASIYSDKALTTPVTGSVITADSQGNYGFYAAPACYKVQISATGFSTQTDTVCLGAEVSANNAFTGNNTHSGTETFTGGITTNALTDTMLTVGNCVQAATGGLLNTVSGPCGTSSGTITATGTPASGNLTKFSGGTSITNGDLSGDCLTSGTLAITCSKLGGITGVDISSTQTLTNKTLDAEATGNVITTPSKIWLAAAGCNNATASPFWDLPTTTPAVAACVTGTNIQKGVLDYADTAGGFSAQNTFILPADFTGAIDARIIWFTTAITGNAKWSLSTICAAVNATVTDDPAFNAASTVTTTAPGTTNWLQTSSITGVTITGCAAGQMLHVKLFRDGNDAADTITATARFYGLEITMRRAM